MKYFTFILFLFFALQIVYSQELAPVVELNVQTEGGSNTDNVEFKLIPNGIQFCKQDGCYMEIYKSMTSYTVKLKGNEICKKSGFQFRECDWGNDVGTSNCGTFSVEYGPLRQSYYRVEVYVDYELKVYFYYDNRDDSFVSNCGNNSCSGNYFTVRYVVNEDKLEFYKQSTISTIIPPDLEISDGDVLTWSDWKCNYRDFIRFWPNGLVIVGERNPILVWGPYNEDNFTVQNYKIYRAVNYSSTPPPLISFAHITTLNSSTYT